MGKFIDINIVNQLQDDKDKDLLIADLTSQLANAQQQIIDMNNIIADMQIKLSGGTI